MLLAPLASFHRWLGRSTAGPFHQRTFRVLFDHVIGNREDTRRNSQAKRLRGFQVDDEFKLGRLHYRQVGGLGALEDAAGIDAT